MIIKTESSQVGYEKKRRVADEYRVPLGPNPKRYIGSGGWKREWRPS